MPNYYFLSSDGGFSRNPRREKESKRTAASPRARKKGEDGWTSVLESRGLRRARNRSLRGNIMEDLKLFGGDSTRMIQLVAGSKLDRANHRV